MTKRLWFVFLSPVLTAVVSAQTASAPKRLIAGLRAGERPGTSVSSPAAAR